MSDNHDDRSIGYWVYQIWKAIAGATGYLAVNLVRVGGALITLGQKPMATSVPIVLASDQSAVPVTATISGTAAVNVAQIGGAALALGQAAMATSVPVVIASDQSAVPVTEFGPWAFEDVAVAAFPYSYTFGGGTFEIDGFSITLVTDANAANRQLSIRIRSDNYTANFYLAPDYDQVASLTRYYIFAPDVPTSAAPTAAGARAGTLYIPAPRFMLGTSDEIVVSVASAQVGDIAVVTYFGKIRA